MFSKGFCISADFLHEIIQPVKSAQSVLHAEFKVRVLLLCRKIIKGEKKTDAYTLSKQKYVSFHSYLGLFRKRSTPIPKKKLSWNVFTLHFCLVQSINLFYVVKNDPLYLQRFSYFVLVHMKVSCANRRMPSGTSVKRRK